MAEPTETTAHPETIVVNNLTESDEAPKALVSAPAGGLGDTWQPSAIARMSEEEFNYRLASMKLEKARLTKIKLAILVKGDADGEGDYGKIPGTKKDSLFQPGAETYNLFARLQPLYFRTEIIGDGVNTPHFRINVECQLIDETRAVHGTGGGSANSWEEKYRYRNSAGLICPTCGVDAVLESRKADQPGFFCWAKRDGCGANFPAETAELTEQDAPGKSEHRNPYDLFNTVEQVADKRAYVKATRTTHALSGIFTQGDPGDIPTGDAPARSSNARGATQFANQTTIRAIQNRADEKAKEFDGVSGNDILRDVFKALAIPNIDQVPQTDVGSVIGEINDWEPGGDAETS